MAQAEQELPKVRRYVLFRLGGEEFGLPIEKVDTVVAYIPPTPVPRSPDIVDGVVNLRGRIIPVVDLRRRFRVPSAEAHNPRILVAESSVGPVGLMVDSASEVVEIDESEVVPAPEAVLTPETSEAFQGVVTRGERLVILLDLDRALAGTGGMPERSDDPMAQEGD